MATTDKCYSVGIELSDDPKLTKLTGKEVRFLLCYLAKLMMINDQPEEFNNLLEIKYHGQTFDELFEKLCGQLDFLEDRIKKER
jgi:hypothetical protein